MPAVGASGSGAPERARRRLGWGHPLGASGLTWAGWGAGQGFPEGVRRTAWGLGAGRGSRWVRVGAGGWEARRGVINSSHSSRLPRSPGAGGRAAPAGKSRAVRPLFPQAPALWLRADTATWPEKKLPRTDPRSSERLFRRLVSAVRGAGAPKPGKRGIWGLDSRGRGLRMDLTQLIPNCNTLISALCG